MKKSMLITSMLVIGLSQSLRADGPVGESDPCPDMDVNEGGGIICHEVSFAGYTIDPGGTGSTQSADALCGWKIVNEENVVCGASVALGPNGE
jgi:hypothetical protein